MSGCICDGVPRAGCDIHGDHGNANSFLDALAAGAAEHKRMTDELIFTNLDKKDGKGSGAKLLENVTKMLSDPTYHYRIELGIRRMHRFTRVAADPRWRPQMLAELYRALNNEDDHGGPMTKDVGVEFICRIGANPKNADEALLLADMCPGAFWSLITLQGPGAPHLDCAPNPPLVDMFLDPSNGFGDAIGKACGLMTDWFLEQMETGALDEPEDNVLAALGVSDEQYPGVPDPTE